MNNLLRRLYGKFLLLISCSLVMSCSENEQSYNHQLHIVATTGMIGDAIKNIVKDSADVVTLMGPGVDPHLYKAPCGKERSISHKTGLLWYETVKSCSSTIGFSTCLIIILKHL